MSDEISKVEGNLSPEQVAGLTHFLSQMTGGVKLRATDEAKLLSEKWKLLSERVVFQPGELVTWKPGMRNKAKPDEGGVGIVVEVLTDPIVEPTSDPGSPYFREPLDIRIGLLDKDGDFLVFYFDSARFMKWNG